MTNLMKGREDFPTGEPIITSAGSGTNDTKEIYCIDTGGASATFSAGIKQIDYDGNKTASLLVGKTFNGVIYGRWTNVKADVQLLCYPII